MLGPSGTPAAEYHVLLSAMGFPIGAGDTFDISWSVNNGSGPEVRFEIHTHEDGLKRYFTARADRLDTSWTVPQTPLPANGSFMISWLNEWPVELTVSYRIVDKAPLDITPLAVVPLAVGLAFGWFLWLRAVPDQERLGPGAKSRGRAAAEPGRAGPPEGPGEPVPTAPMDDDAFQRAVMENARGQGNGAPGPGAGKP